MDQRFVHLDSVMAFILENISQMWTFSNPYFSFLQKSPLKTWAKSQLYFMKGRSAKKHPTRSTTN